MLNSLKGITRAFAFILMVAAPAMSQDLRWARTLGASNNTAFDQEVSSRSVKTDESGNVFVTGSYYVSDGCRGVYISKYNSSGDQLWTKTFQGGCSTALSLAVDNSGNVVVGGTFTGEVDFDAGDGSNKVTAPSGGGSFFTKYSGDGDHDWTKTWEASVMYIYAIGVTSTNDYYFTGAFTGLIDFNPDEGTDLHHNPQGESWDVFVVKLLSSGDYSWMRVVGGSGTDYGYGIATYSSNQIVVGGVFNTTLGIGSLDPFSSTFDLGHTSNGSVDIFLVSFNSSGDVTWSKAFGGDNADYLLNLASDSNGNFGLTGVFKSTVDFDAGGSSDLKSAAGTGDAFLASYSRDGAYRWAKTFGDALDDSGEEMGYGVALDSAGGTYVVGKFSGTVDFDGSDGQDNHSSVGNLDLFVSKYSSSGAYQWTRTVAGGGSDPAYGLAVNSSGHLFVAGGFFEAIDLDPGSAIDTRSPKGTKDVFLISLKGADESTLPTPDTKAPRVRPEKAAGSPGERLTLTYYVSDSSGSTSEAISVFKGKKKIWSKDKSLSTLKNKGKRSVKYRAPKRVSSTAVYKFCVVATDVEGNSSPSKCAKIILGG